MFRELVSAGIAQRYRPDLVRGGRVRSPGAWGGEFVASVLREAELRQAERLRIKTRRMSSSELERRVARAAELEEGKIRTAARRRAAFQARRAFRPVGVRELRYAWAEVARYFGVTTSCVNLEAGKAELERPARSTTQKFLRLFRHSDDR